MKRLLISAGLIFVIASSASTGCTRYEDEDFEFAVDPSIGQGSNYRDSATQDSSSDSTGDTATDTGTDTDTDTGTDTDTDTATDTDTDTGTA